MNTNTTGFECFQKALRLCALDESSLSIGRVEVPGQCELEGCNS